MFVDASAIVAILSQESGYTNYVAALDESDHRYTSIVALYEAALALVRKNISPIETVAQDLENWCGSANIRIAALEAEMFPIAITAHQRFGKGRGHPAQLNMGDCLAYAAAQTLSLPLLFKGKDFAMTDATAVLSEAR